MSYVPVRGGELYYEDVGKGPVIVLVHGTTGNSDHWYQQVPAFVRAGYRCVRFDTRGYGRSRIEPGQEAVGTIADDIEAVRSALNLGKIFVVGQANGAEGAIDYGLDFSSNTRAVVACTSFRTGDAEPSHVALRDRLVPTDVRQRPRVQLQLGATYRATHPEGVKRFMAIDAANNRPTPDPKAPAPAQERRQPSDFARLAKMTVPTLVVAADEDILTPPALMKDLADHIPGSEFVIIPHAGRYSFWENPKDFNKAVLAFFRKVRSRRAGLGRDIKVRQGFAEVEGARLYFEDAGASYRTVVFVHDVGEDSERWSTQVPDFIAAGYRCIRFDQRGHGRSTGEKTGWAADDIHGLVDALQLGSFYVVAAGRAAAGVVDFTLRHTDRVRGLALAGTSVPGPSSSRLNAIGAPVLRLGRQDDRSPQAWSRHVIDFLATQA